MQEPDCLQNAFENHGLEGLTAEEIAAILDELDNFDEVEEADSELKNVDEDLEFLEILTVRRLPCTAHKVRIN